MNKNFIKKIIVSIVFIIFLIIFFSFVNNFRSHNNNDISIVNNIIKNKYDDIKYDDKTGYLYSINKKNDLYIYEVYDTNGNKLYKIESGKSLNIISVTKNYYIIFDKKYFAYNREMEEIISDNDISSLNDYLIKVNNKIVNYKGKVLLDNVKMIKSYDYSSYFCVNDNYLIDKRGTIILENVKVVDEVLNKNKYLIVQRDNMYYTFYTSLESIVGDGFINYVKDKKVYIDNGTNKYVIYGIGIRKKIDSKDYPNNKEMLIFANGYKTIKQDKHYVLLDDRNKEIIKLDEQIVIEGIDIKNGKINKYSYVYDLNKKTFFKVERKITNKKTYFLYVNNNKKIIYDERYKKVVETYGLVYFGHQSLIYQYKDNLVFKNNRNNRIKKIKIGNSKIVLDRFYRNILLIEEKDGIKVINIKGNIIKEIKNSNIVEYYYDKKTGKLIIITLKNNYKGSYVCE